MEPLAHAEPSRNDLSRLSPVVGREREQVMLGGALSAAFAGSGRLVLVAGEAGIGKSTMLRWVADQASGKAARVLAGHCYDLTTTPAYGPWMEVFRAVSNDDVLSDLPEVTQLERSAPGVESQPEFFTLAENLLRSAANVRPLVVLLEDLHWADQGSLDLLRFLSRTLVDQPVLMVGSFRDDEVSRDSSLYELLPAIVREGHVQRITLSRLNRSGIRDLTRIYCQHPIEHEERLVHYLEQRAEGNPFFACELLHMLTDERVMTVVDGVWQLGSLTDAGVPILIQQIVARRINPLAEPVRTLLELAAVIGQETSLELLQSLYPGTATELDEALQGAIEHRLLLVTSDQQGVQFTHALVRQAVYESIAPLRRRRMHRQVGEFLSSRYRPDPDSVAEHLYQAGDELAIDWLVRAAEQAQQLFAPQAVLTRCDQALDLTSRLGVRPPIVVYRLRGLAREMDGDLDGARQSLESALELAEQQADRQATWQSLLDLGANWASREYQRAGQYLEQALSIAREIGDPLLIGQSLNRLGNWHVNLEQFDLGLARHRKALEIFQGLDDRAGTAATYDLVGLALVLSGDAAGSVEYYDRAIPLLREIDDRQVLTMALVTASAARFGVQHALFGSTTDHIDPAALDDRYAAIDEAIGIARDIGWRAGEAFCLVIGSRMAQEFGDYDRGLREGRKGVALARRIGHPQWQILGLATLGPIYADLLDHDRAREELEKSHVLAERTGSQFLIGTTTAFLAETYIARGEIDRAERLIDGRADLSQPPATGSQRNYWWVQIGLHLARGDSGIARELLTQLDDSISGPASGRPVKMRKLRGQVFMADGNYDEAEPALLDALDSAAAFGYRPLHWRILALLHSLYQIQGRFNEAKRRREEALTLIEDLADCVNSVDPELGEHFRAAGRRLLPEHVPFSPDSRRGLEPDGLTAREIEVLELVSQGMTDAQVSEQLFISPRTVSQHLRSIYSKLDVANRTAAVRAAQERSLLP